MFRCPYRIVRPFSCGTPAFFLASAAAFLRPPAAFLRPPRLSCVRPRPSCARRRFLASARGFLTSAGFLLASARGFLTPAGFLLASAGAFLRPPAAFFLRPPAAFLRPPAAFLRPPAAFLRPPRLSYGRRQLSCAAGAFLATGALAAATAAGRTSVLAEPPAAPFSVSEPIQPPRPRGRSCLFANASSVEASTQLDAEYKYFAIRATLCPDRLFRARTARRNWTPLTSGFILWPEARPRRAAPSGDRCGEAADHRRVADESQNHQEILARALRREGVGRPRPRPSEVDAGRRRPQRIHAALPDHQREGRHHQRPQGGGESAPPRSTSRPTPIAKARRSRGISPSC